MLVGGRTLFFTRDKVEKLDVIKNLVERGIIRSCETERKMISKTRRDVYLLTDDFKNDLTQKALSTIRAKAAVSPCTDIQ